MLGTVRHSSSSLSSHTSSETGNMVILTDSSVGENAEDVYHMQVSRKYIRNTLQAIYIIHDYFTEKYRVYAMCL